MRSTTRASLILLVSPSLRQSTELFRKVTGLLDRLPAASPAGARRPALTEDNRLSCVLANRSRIVSLPSSEATIRGFSGAALIIEDEASRVSDDLYRAVRPMLATSGGRLILMSTPYGRRGHFWDVWDAVRPRRVTRVERCPGPRAPPARASAPGSWPRSSASLGPWWYAQEYDCEFIDAASSAFTWDMVQAAQKEPVQTMGSLSQSTGHDTSPDLPPISLGVHVGVDLGQKLDYTAFVVVEMQRRGYTRR